MKTHTRMMLYALPLALIVLAADPAISFSATITIVNVDGAGEGFNDPTPAAPVGGNPGTTIGQQRLNVFNQAASIWGGILPSAVPILVQAQFNALSCTATSAVLGSAGTINVTRDFTGAEFAGTWYHTALGNKEAGVDLVVGGNDINATFNSNLGQVGCLTGVTFYYGFDHNEGSNIDLLAVVLHELGHGLGFSGFANLTTGQQLSGFPGVYERFLHDNSSGLNWNAMSDAQRQASAINDGNVVWNGTAVTVKAPTFLAPRSEVVVTSPGAIAGTYTSGTPSFGASLTIGGVTGQVVLVDDGSSPNSDGCSALVNAGAVSGKIALLDRGTCTFFAKAQACQNAGAIGMIMVNNVAGQAPDIGGTGPGITIPVTSVSLTVGNAIKAQLGGGVTATLKIDASKLAGADNANHVGIFAPNPIQNGSSISHFDVTASPNLLMEPIINADLTDVDLTRYAFEDEGWLPRTTPTLLALVSADLVDGAAVLDWYAAGDPLAAATVERRTDGTGWSLLAPLATSGDGHVRYVDRALPAAARVGYRLRWSDSDGPHVSAETWLEIPSTEFALSGAWPNPSRSTPAFAIEMPRSGAIDVDVFDVRGRRIAHERTATLAAGRQRVTLAATLHPGVYLARVAFSDRRLETRFVVLQ